MAEKINAGHAKNRALVEFPGHFPGTTMHGRLVSVGGRRRPKNQAVIILSSGRYISRPVDELRLVPEPPRVLP